MDWSFDNVLFIILFDFTVKALVSAVLLTVTYISIGFYMLDTSIDCYLD